MAKATEQNGIYDRIKEGTIKDLGFDNQNANEGSESGDYVLTTSVERCGVGRGVVCDRNGVLIGGNKTAAKVGELDAAQDVVFVETTGETLVVTVRKDLDLLAPEDSEEYQKARELSVADNWASVKNTSLVGEVLAEYKEQGVQIGKYISDADLEGLMGGGDDGPGGGDEGKEKTSPPCPNCGYVANP